MDVVTAVSAEELSPLLRRWAPWRHLIRFSNGLATDQFETGRPFNANPLAKLRKLDPHLPWADLEGGRALDIGFNCGYNSIALAAQHGMSVVGIDVTPRHAEVATFLAETVDVGARTRFELADATTFQDREPFDLVLHLGTLYHLPNPVLALETTAGNLRPGGWLALETQVYVGADQSLSKFIRGDGGDDTNWWSLSERTLEALFDYVGFVDVDQVFRTTPAWMDDDQARAIYVCRKPG
jgi:SAM-dependent methyltransferase